MLGQDEVKVKFLKGKEDHKQWIRRQCEESEGGMNEDDAVSCMRKGSSDRAATLRLLPHCCGGWEGEGG